MALDLIFGTIFSLMAIYSGKATYDFYQKPDKYINMFIEAYNNDFYRHRRHVLICTVFCGLMSLLFICFILIYLF